LEEELRKVLLDVIKDKRYLQILRHLRIANVDYGKSIMKNTKIPIDQVVTLLDDLERMGLVERVPGATVKNTEAKFKLSHEVHKHHTYYRLTRLGDHLLRNLTEDELIKAYADFMKSNNDYLTVLSLAEKLNADHALTYAKLSKKPLEETMKVIEELIRAGLLEEKHDKIIKFGERKAKPKKETRTHHKYYGLTREGEFVVRYLKRTKVIS
jgi:predicted transcriptional regulator